MQTEGVAISLLAFYVLFPFPNILKIDCREKIRLIALVDGKWMNTVIKGIVDHPKCKYMKNLQIKSDQNGQEMKHTVLDKVRTLFHLQNQRHEKMLDIELKYT